MRVEPDYRGFRIEVTAIQDERAWNVEVRIDRVPADGDGFVEMLPYRLPTADDAERRGAIYARRWVDRNPARRP